MNRRIMLKLSGEALSGKKDFGFDEELLLNICNQIKSAKDTGNEICLLVGGGNFLRGRDLKNIDQVKADQIGMLSTVMNGIFVSEMLKSIGIEVDIYSAFACEGIVDIFSKDKAVDSIKKGRVVLFVGGTGHPYFTTDTGVVLRALEMDCTEILFAKSVDGVYDSDPKINPNAKKYDSITFNEILEKNLEVVDKTCIALIANQDITLRLFALNTDNSIKKAINGEKIGTIVTK